MIEDDSALSPEEALSSRDSILADIVARNRASWPRLPAEDPVWGLVRMILAQQVSTTVARRRAARVLELLPELVRGEIPPGQSGEELFRKAGATGRQARCCLMVLARANQIRSAVQGPGFDHSSLAIPGIGPWTVSCFRVLVLRHEDVLPEGDVGLERAFRLCYGSRASLKRRSDGWRPYRSVAVWHLWRSLGNEPLG